MEIEKVLINDRLLVSKVSLQFRIPTVYNFAVIIREICNFLKNAAYFLTVFIVFSVYKQNFTAK